MTLFEFFRAFCLVPLGILLAVLVLGVFVLLIVLRLKGYRVRIWWNGDDE